VKTPSSSRIIGAEQLTGVRPFALSEFGAAGAERIGFAARAGAAGAPSGMHDEDDPAFVAGRAIGLRDGMRRGAEAAQQQFAREHAQARAAELATLGERTTRLVSAIEEQFHALRQGIADEVVELAIELARQTVRRALLSERDLIVDVAREAVGALIDERASFSLHLNPADLPEVEQALAHTLHARGAMLVPDSAIAVGGCRIVCAGAEIDATVGTRWRRTLAAIGRSLPEDAAGVDVTAERAVADRAVVTAVRGDGNTDV
jgi:flagellar assembly protein FliH